MNLLKSRNSKSLHLEIKYLLILYQQALLMPIYWLKLESFLKKQKEMMTTGPYPEGQLV